MKWLITGGCGFIGTSLLAALKREGGHQVRVLDDLSVGSAADLGEVSAYTTIDGATLASTPWSDSATQLVIGDIRDEDLTAAVAQGADVIIHLAANTGVQPSVQDPRRDCTINVLGTLNLLEAARAHGVRRFVLASSGGTVIGDCEPPIHEDLVPRPKSPYGASKSAGEGYLSAYHGSFGIDTVALRFSNVYGPRSSHKNSVVARCIRRALQGRSLEIFGDGLQTRDYVYIDDLVAAIRLAAAVDGLGGEVYQVATERETSVRELTAMLVRLFAEAGLGTVPVTEAQALPGEIRRNYSDTSKIRRATGWAPEVELEDGLNRTLHWFLQQRRLATP